MDVFKKKLKELVYSFSTDDHYAEYNENEIKDFHMGQRLNNRSNPDVNHDEEMNIGMDEYNDARNNEFESSNSYNNEGVSEALLAWRHIDSWSDDHNPDLSATLSEPCTKNDITHAEEDLEISFPASVKASLRIHDGQEDLESMTGTSGLIYGLQLMTLDQIVSMTQAWRNVAKNLNRRNNNLSTMSSNNSSAAAMTESQTKSQFKLPYIPTQSSIPPETILPVYAHPAWIPLVTDHAGNHIGVDLSPGPNGKYGQVIIFGRDFDTKYAINSNWGEFLLSFANDLEAGNWFLINDSDDYYSGEGELVFRDKKSNGVVQDYLEVLKQRCWTKYQEQNLNNNSNVEPNTEIESTKFQSPVKPHVIINKEEEEEEEHNVADVSMAESKVDNEEDIEAIITDDEDEHDEIAKIQSENTEILGKQDSTTELRGAGEEIQTEESAIALTENKDKDTESPNEDEIVEQSREGEVKEEDVQVEEHKQEDVQVEEPWEEEAPAEEQKEEEAPVEESNEQKSVEEQDNEKATNEQDTKKEEEEENSSISKPEEDSAEKQSNTSVENLKEEFESVAL
ncbi:hypothetical protein KAFR_0B04230 [Kazachstania africana CBS 2517]|uniref:Knr4/Smi1-like domain-containing protein n=1 Tax=Kazachstania africana (strain ATCC 22294 / BCRC 22015 / CBS 2517 / CECT 1963 / NBRC 1671 / NRRL Y-8276) TaxID=1071382 RepID=H2AQR9_KAZAF|nr:hypothetical protein KAFR_0B04230 [Kazachstania africana CBS 2517]CCF56719.1 hypothetical protein KAFR_0B04230 [Kazachstania africana CBS 2517]